MRVLFPQVFGLTVRNQMMERHFQSQGHIEYIKLTLGASFENVSKTVIRAGGNPIP